jgi:VanZ family protein
MTRHDPALPAPAFLRKWQVWAGLMFLFLFPFFIRIPRALNHHPVISPVGDQVHIFLFAGVTFLLYWFGPLQGRIWRAAIVSAIMGGSVEFLQLLVGRQALLKDFLLDLVGIGLVVCFIMWKGHRIRAGKWIFWLLLASIPLQLYYLPWRIEAAYRAKAMFPVLADFEHRSDRYLWGANMSGKLDFTEIPDAPEGTGRVLRILGDDETPWPGAVMRRFPDDWSDHATLKFDARMVEGSGDSVRFSLRLDDYEGIREVVWTYQSFEATHGWRTFTMDIADRKLWNSDRNLELTEMDRLIIYFPQPQEPVTVEIDNIRLE